jgi:hypothetical protein
MYYDFLLNLWVLNRLSESQINTAVQKGYITQDQANTILNTPKAVSA